MTDVGPPGITFVTATIILASIAMAKQRDWILRLILACSGFALSASLLAFMLSAFQLPIFAENLQRVDFSNLPWLQGVDVVDLGLSLFLLALLLYAAAQQRAMTNIQLQYTAGCPACSEKKLVRVSRQTADRLLGISLIPMGRFVCPDCRWEGRRVIRKSACVKKPAKPSTSEKLVIRVDEEPAGSLVEPGMLAAEPSVRVVNKKPAAKLTSTLSSNSEMSPAISGNGFQMADQRSDHVITVHGGGGDKGQDLGGVVGSLRLLLWQVSGSETDLQAYLEHSTTKVTIYEKINVAAWTPKYSTRKDTREA
jgi:hypothetical protein